MDFSYIETWEGFYSDYRNYPYFKRTRRAGALPAVFVAGCGAFTSRTILNIFDHDVKIGIFAPPHCLTVP